MIRQVRGSVVAAGDNYLIVEAGDAAAGIGLRVFTPEPTAARCLVGDPVGLHTHLHVRENELSLYGFEQQDELAIFEALLGVSGVGPKVALAALGALTPESLRLPVSNRTAEKVVVELKDKLAPAEGDLAALATAPDADAEVMEALTSLGYSVVEAQRALQQIPADVTGVEERLRLALSRFGE